MNPIDSQTIEALAAKYPDHFCRKFCDWRYYLAQGRGVARELGLHDGPKQRILDLGCGFGYFVYAACELGHDAEGLELDTPMHREAIAAVGVRCTYHQIRADNRLPAHLTGYDLVTCYGVTLHRDDMSAWGWTEREVHARDVLDRLVAGGRWVTMYNWGHHNEPYLDPEGWERVVGHEATVHVRANVVTIVKRGAKSVERGG